MELNEEDHLYLSNNNYSDDEYFDNEDCCAGMVCDFQEDINFEAVFIPVVYSLALLVGLLGNSLLLWVLGRRSNTWSVTDNFIVHLGVADSLLLVTLPFWATQATPIGWVFGTPFCKVAGALFTVGFGLNRTHKGLFSLSTSLDDLFRHLEKFFEHNSRAVPLSAKCIHTSVLVLPDQLLLRDLPVGLHQPGPLPVHRPRYTHVLPQEALDGAGQLPVSMAPLPAPLHP